MTSKLENQYKEKHSLKKLDTNLPVIFHDKEEAEFRAKGDFAIQHQETGRIILIEFKSASLGTIQTIKSSKNKLRNRCEHRGLHLDKAYLELNHDGLSSLLFKMGFNYDSLLHGWNHQGAKHQVVSEVITNLGLDYIIVFSDPTPFMGKKKTPYKIHYENKYGLKCISEIEFSERYNRKNYISLDDLTLNAIILEKMVSKEIEEEVCEVISAPQNRASEA